MTRPFFDYHHTRTSEDAEQITDQKIERCSDEAALGRWFTGMHELYEQLRAKVEAQKFCETADKAWLDRVGGKIAWLRVGMRKVEARMIELGFAVPYPPIDPRVREIRHLTKSVQRLKALLREHGIDPEEG